MWHDPLAEEVLEAANTWWAQIKSGTGRKITPKRLLRESLASLVPNPNVVEYRRVANILRAHGWRQKPDKDGAHWVKTER
jgi:hypothetical protein